MPDRAGVTPVASTARAGEMKLVQSPWTAQPADAEAQDSRIQATTRRRSDHALRQKYAGIMEPVWVDMDGLSMLRGVDPAISSRITTAWGRCGRGLRRKATARVTTQVSYRIDEMHGLSFAWGPR